MSSLNRAVQEREQRSRKKCATKTEKEIISRNFFDRRNEIRKEKIANRNQWDLWKRYKNCQRFFDIREKKCICLSADDNSIAN